MKIKSNRFDFYRMKYGKNLLIDLIRLETLEQYIRSTQSHYLSYFDVTLITEGEGQFVLNERVYELKKGLVVFSLPGQIRKWDFNKVPKGYVLIFEKAFLTSFLSDSQFIDKLSYFNHNLENYSLKLNEADTLHLIQLCQAIEEEVKGFKNSDEHILRALLFQVLIWLNRKFKASEPVQHDIETNRHIRSFVNLVSAKFKEEHSVLFYADALNISAGHLNDLSKSVLGTNAKKYISERIMTEVQRLLVFTDLSISDIALELGFIDTSYFIRWFKSEAGQTPFSFRKEQNP